jgi:hypothetical protein
MIYFTTTDGRAVLIIESGNLERLKSGKPMKTPDEKFLVCYTPDMEWTMDQFQGMLAVTTNSVDPAIMDFILKEGMKRQEIKR